MLVRLLSHAVIFAVQRCFIHVTHRGGFGRHRLAGTMAPFSAIYPRNLPIRRDGRYPHGRESMVLSSVVLEGWSQGVLFGGLVVLILFTIANMRRQVLLHWLIMVEAGYLQPIALIGTAINCSLAHHCPWTLHIHLLPRSNIRMVSCFPFFAPAQH